MICVCLISILGLSWMFLPCEGQISVTSDKKNIKILQGKDLEITWKVSGIKASDLDSRAWTLLKKKQILAKITNDDKTVINNGTILAQGFEVRKPSTLYLKNVDERYDGGYEFAVTEGFGTDEFVVTVSVLRKPNVTINCSNPITVDEDHDLICLCKGENGNPPPDVIWYDNRGNSIGQNETEQKSLVLRNVTVADSGNYTCKAQSYTLIDEKSTEVKVSPNYKPNKTNITLSSTSVMSGQEVNITCTSNGQPDPSFTIIHNGTNITVDGNTYTIRKANLSHAGNYTCVAINKLGSHKSKPQFLNVTVKAPTTPMPTEITSTVMEVSQSTGQTSMPTKSGTGKTKTKKSFSTLHIILIIVGVLVLILIIVVVVYYYKKRARNGYKGNPNVNPDDGNVGVNHYELEEDNAYDSVKGDNAYDSANPPGSSASTSKPPEDTMPPVYAAVDKDNRKGKTLYATLDSVALESDGSQKRKDDRPPPTEYADINFLKKKPDQNAGEAV